jgi:hypothetical protein
MGWTRDLRGQVREEFRTAQRVRGGIVDRDTKPDNLSHQEIVEIVNLPVRPKTTRRRIVWRCA